MRYALALEYDGRSFCGFQSQPSRCGVQDALARALASIAGERIEVVAAGRTDAGVHATSQIVHFDAAATRPMTAWVRGVNTSLPTAAAVLWAQAVDDSFHARFAAQARHYSYLLMNRTQRPALCAGRVGWYHRPLDVAAMQRACARLVGEHDFSSFRAAGCQAKSPVKTLDALDVTRDGDEVRIRTSARSFLHNQVRSMVGSLKLVGEGRWGRSDLEAALAARDRGRCGPVAPPHGLYLLKVDY